MINFNFSFTFQEMDPYEATCIDVTFLWFFRQQRAERQQRRDARLQARIHREQQYEYWVKRGFELADRCAYLEGTYRHQEAVQRAVRRAQLISQGRRIRLLRRTVQRADRARARVAVGLALRAVSRLQFQPTARRISLDLRHD